MRHFSGRNARGSDAIPAEIYKHDGRRRRLMDQLTMLFQEMWRCGQVYRDFMDATIVHLYKRKGNRQSCDNHRGISLHSIVRNVFVRILLSHLNGHLEQGLLPDSGDSVRPLIFVARHLEKQFQEMRTYLYTNFRGYDENSQQGELGRTVKNRAEVRLSRAIYAHGASAPRWENGARVTDNGAISEAFVVTNRMKRVSARTQSCLSLIFSAVLIDVYRDQRPGIRIDYRTDENILNSRRMQALTRLSTVYIHGRLLSDDRALNSTAEEDMQRSKDLFTSSCAHFGLKVIIHQTRRWSCLNSYRPLNTVSFASASTAPH
nr:unnamed protein product [Spirometra erinaceieuropaei]